MKNIFKNLIPYKNKIATATVLMTFATVCDLLLPTIMSDIVDKGIYLSDMEFIKKNCIYMFIVSLFGLVTVILGRKYTVSRQCS